MLLCQVFLTNKFLLVWEKSWKVFLFGMMFLSEKNIWEQGTNESTTCYSSLWSFSFFLMKEKKHSSKTQTSEEKINSANTCEQQNETSEVKKNNTVRRNKKTMKRRNDKRRVHMSPSFKKRLVKKCELQVAETLDNLAFFYFCQPFFATL